MAQSQSGFDMEEYNLELDKMMENVMPAKWSGHGRLKLASRGFSGKKGEFSKKLFERLEEKHPDADSEVLAEKAAEMAEKKLG